MLFSDCNRIMEKEETRLALWCAVAERSKQLAYLEKIPGDDLVAIIYSFGMKRLRHLDSLVILIESVLPQLPLLKTNSLVQFVYGLARLKVRSDVAFKAAAREIAGRAAEMSGRQLA